MPPGSSIVHSISRAAKSLIGTRTVNRKEPMSPDTVTKLVEVSNVDNLLQLRNVCIFVLAFADFLELKKFFMLSTEILSFKIDM